MRPAFRLTAFAFALAALFAVAVIAGGAADPDTDKPQTAHESPSKGGGATGHEDMNTTTSSSHDPRGLAVADDGLRLVPQRSELARGAVEPFRFRIQTARGRAVSDFDVEHERRMHVIVVRRDLTGYQHVHPRHIGAGVWETDLRLDEAGSYRVFADFSYRGEPYTLGTDVTVPGRFDPVELPPVAHRADAGDGYTVDARDEDGELRFTVKRDGEVLEDIEPYLGARGHLVALREGDLAFLHVHPNDEATQGRDVSFGVEYPTAGRYRLFLQFKHDGRVHTAAFTREATGSGAAKEAGDAHGH